MKDVKLWAALTAAAGIFVSGCDSTTASTEGAQPAVREATAKAPGALPFGNEFIWWSKFDWNTKNIATQKSGFVTLFDYSSIMGKCYACSIIRNTDSVESKTVRPGIYTYIITLGAELATGSTDGDVDGYIYKTDANGNLVLDANGNKIVVSMMPKVTKVGAAWVATHRDSILLRYKILADSVQKTLEKRKYNTMPFVYLLEGDFFQFSSTNQTKYMSPTQIATLLSDVSDTIKRYNPSSRVGFNVSGWHTTDFMVEYFRATRKKNFDFIWINTGINSDTIDNNVSAMSTITWIRRFTGLPIVIEGFSTLDVNKLKARIDKGIVGSRMPNDWSDVARAQFIAAGSALPNAKVLPTNFSNLAPNISLNLVRRLNNDANQNSLQLGITAWDPDAVFPVNGTSAVKQVDVFLNGRLYGTATPNALTYTNTGYSAVISNLPLPKPGEKNMVSVSVTDNEGVTTSLPAFDAGATFTVDTSKYAYRFKSTDAGQMITFKLFDRSKTNKRIKFQFFNPATNALVAQVHSDDVSGWGGAGPGVWTKDIALPAASVLPQGKYRVVMLYNDDNLRNNYGNAFTLKSMDMSYDPKMVYQMYGSNYCPVNFVLQPATQFCIAK